MNFRSCRLLLHHCIWPTTCGLVLVWSCAAALVLLSVLLSSWSPWLLGKSILHNVHLCQNLHGLLH